MANTSAPRGLVPVRDGFGRPYNGSGELMYVASSVASNIGIGDPVIVSGSGDANGVPGCTLASAGGGAYISGVVVGIDQPTYGSVPYHAASTAGYVLVERDPDTLFEIQEDAVGGALAAADIGLNADLVSGTMNTANGLSAWQLDTSTKNTTNTLQLRIVGFQQRPDNEVGANAKVLVRINLHTSRNTTGS